MANWNTRTMGWWVDRNRGPWPENPSSHSPAACINHGPEPTEISLANWLKKKSDGDADGSNANGEPSGLSEAAKISWHKKMYASYEAQLDTMGNATPSSSSRAQAHSYGTVPAAMCESRALRNTSRPSSAASSGARRRHAARSSVPSVIHRGFEGGAAIGSGVVVKAQRPTSATVLPVPLAQTASDTSLVATTLKAMDAELLISPLHEPASSKHPFPGRYRARSTSSPFRHRKPARRTFENELKWLPPGPPQAQSQPRSRPISGHRASAPGLLDTLNAIEARESFPRSLDVASAVALNIQSGHGGKFDKQRIDRLRSSVRTWESEDDAALQPWESQNSAAEDYASHPALVVEPDCLQQDGRPQAAAILAYDP